MKVVQLFMVSMLSVMLILSGCGGGGGSSTPDQVAGVVADGYLIGAVVFSDQNGNKLLDDGEPNTKTTEGGAYTLVGKDVNKYPVVVLVRPEDGVVDTDYPDTTVEKAYILSAPAGNAAFVSPLTTLVQEQIDSNPALDVESAEALVKAQLGVNVDLFIDYVAEGETSADYATAHKVAQVVTATFAEMKADIEAAAEAAGLDLDESLDAIVSMVVEEVMAQLGDISVAVAEVDPETVFDQATVDGIVATTVDPVDTSSTEAIAEEIAENQIPVSLSVFEEILQSGGIYWLEIYSGESNPDGSLAYVDAEYGHVAGTDGGNLVEADYIWDNEIEAWVEEVGDTDSSYLLNAAGEWVATDDGASSYSIAFNADGTATITHKVNGTQAKLSVAEFDISGLPMAEITELGGYLANPDAVFPADSKAYSMNFIPLSDTYSVWGDNADWQNVVGVWDMDVKTPVYGGFVSVLSAFSYGNLDENYLGVSRDLNVQFGADGTLYLYGYTGNWPPSPLEATGTWSYKTVFEQSLLMLDIPKTLWDAYDIDETIFFAEFSDAGLTVVKQGGFEPANIPDTGEMELNETAFNAIKENLAFGGGEVAPPVEVLAITSEMVSGQTFVAVDPQAPSEFELITLQTGGTLILQGREWDDQLMTDVDYYEVGAWSLADGVVTGIVGGGSATVSLVEDGADALTILFSESEGLYSGQEIWKKTAPFVAVNLIGKSYALSEGQTMTFVDGSHATFTEQGTVMDFTWSVNADGTLLADFSSPEGTMIRTILLLAGGSESSFQIAGFGGEGEMFEVFMDTLTLVQ